MDDNLNFSKNNAQIVNGEKNEFSFYCLCFLYIKKSNPAKSIKL